MSSDIISHSFTFFISDWLDWLVKNSDIYSQREILLLMFILLRFQESPVAFSDFINSRFEWARRRRRRKERRCRQGTFGVPRGRRGWGLWQRGKSCRRRRKERKRRSRWNRRHRQESGDPRFDRCRRSRWWRRRRGRGQERGRRHNEEVGHQRSRKPVLPQWVPLPLSPDVRLPAPELEAEPISLLPDIQHHDPVRRDRHSQPGRGTWRLHPLPGTVQYLPRLPLRQQRPDQPRGPRPSTWLPSIHGSDCNACWASSSLRPIRRALHFISATAATCFNVFSGLRLEPTLSRHRGSRRRLHSRDGNWTQLGRIDDPSQSSRSLRLFSSQLGRRQQLCAS